MTGRTGMTKDERSNLRDRVRAEKRARDLTLKEIAYGMRVTLRAVETTLCRPAVTMPTMLQRIAAYLGVDEAS